MRILIASDVHARPDEPGREESFRKFLEKEGTRSDRLYLLGDIFEFGFVFRGKVLPVYQSLINDIVRLVEKGVEVFFLGGNHDMWMSSYLQRKGLRIINNTEIHKILGRRVQFFHGILLERDAFSRFSSRIMKAPGAVWLYSRLPARLGFSIALKAALFSRERNTSFRERFRTSRLRPSDPRAEIIISAHHHNPMRFDFGGKSYFCTGDWIENFTYLEITPGGVEFKTFK